MNPATHSLVTLVSDVTVKLIFAVPLLRNKLQHLLNQPSQVEERVKQLYTEIVQTASPDDLKQLEVYLTQYTQQSALISVFQKAFTNIFADGKVDIQDSVHFMTLVHDVVTCFNAGTAVNAPSSPIQVSSECVLLFLKFALKCILALTLDDAQEKQALQLVDHSFVLLQLSVAPIEVNVPATGCSSCRCIVM